MYKMIKMIIIMKMMMNHDAHLDGQAAIVSKKSLRRRQKASWAAFLWNIVNETTMVIFWGKQWERVEDLAKVEKSKKQDEKLTSKPEFLLWFLEPGNGRKIMSNDNTTKLNRVKLQLGDYKALPPQSAIVPFHWSFSRTIQLFANHTFFNWVAICFIFSSYRPPLPSLSGNSNDDKD